ncbi:MAG: hypothetical protein ACYDER_22970 [Ktedonobacteraceae bacterium]
MKKFLRWPVFVLLAVLVLAGLIPTVPLLHADAIGKAHASEIHGGPQISLSPYTNVAPGSTITVTGSGYTPGESVHIFVQGYYNQGVMATVDSTGAFTAALTAPITHKPLVTTLYVYADSTNGKDKARSYFTFASVFATIGCSCNFGTQATFTGQGFAVNEKVKILWNYQLPGQVTAAIAQAGSDGTFTLTVTIPSDPDIVRTPVAAIGVTSKLTYVTDAIEYPGLVLNHYSGRPGTKIRIMGGGFSVNEQVTVSFRGTTIATVTSDASGGITTTYVLPPNHGAGNATIQAVGGTSGVSVQTIFGYTPTLAMTPTTGPSGTIITLTGHQFSANTTANFYWYDPSSGSKTYIGNAGTDANGNFKGHATAPAGLTGGNQYFVQAVDNLSRVVVQLPFVAQSSCVQCIQLTPNTGIPGSTTTVNGSNFTPGETVNIYFQQTGNGVVITTVNSSGTFSASLTVPKTYSQKVAYYVYAVSTNGNDKASAQFIYTQPMVYPDDPYDGYTYGEQMGFSGSGFAINEQVDFFWDYGKLGTFKAGTTTAASDGTISATLTIPSVPYNAQINLVAYGTTSTARATTPITETEAIAINPTTGYAGTTVTVNGGGFTGNETITIQFEAGPIITTVATITANARGGFTTSFVVPTSDEVGGNGVQATGSTSHLSVGVSFWSPPTLTITPNTGTSGTVIQVTGSHYIPNSTYTMLWYNPTNNTDITLGNITTSAQGTLSATITAPSGLVSGTTYYVQIFDVPSNFAWAQAPFIAQ